MICNHVTVVTRKKTSYRRKFESVKKRHTLTFFLYENLGYIGYMVTHL